MRWVAFASSLASTHAVDVSGHIDEGVASLDCHRTYIDNLGDPDFDPDSFLRGSCQQVGKMAGVPFAVSFELVPV